MSLGNSYSWAADQGACEVCLVNMPYVAVTRPSIALGLLQQILNDKGISTTVAYANLWFTEKVGIPLYHTCSHQSPPELQAGEWTFAKAAFPDSERKDSEYLDVVRDSLQVKGKNHKADGNNITNDLLALREHATEFVDETARKVLNTGARIVGCTSTFEQHVASLALLRKIKELDPTVTTILGGANCEAVMGEATHRNFPWVDYVFSGEADGIISEVFAKILAGQEKIPANDLPTGVLGPLHRTTANGNGSGLDRAMFDQLDSLPVPDFHDYFETLSQSGLDKYVIPGLPLETSRGCWWGAKKHCTFCGLNGSSMSYRSKSSERVLDEVRQLETRHGISNFEVVDNILDMQYFKSLLPRMAMDIQKRRFFYEVKSNLKREHIELLKNSGITWIQPGIESLHTEVLKLIDKGVTGWQNIQLLRWCRELGVRLSWSILWDFPGEESEWYDDMALNFPYLEHLQAPNGMVRLRYDRFSVYHSKAKELGLKLWPFSAMRYVYPLSIDELRDLAYFFVQENGPDTFNIVGKRIPGLSDSIVNVVKGVKQWRSAFWQQRPVLCVENSGNELDFFDTRQIATQLRTRLGGLLRCLYLTCETPPLIQQIPYLLEQNFQLAPGQSELDEAINDLKSYGFVIEVDNRLIALALRGEVPQLPGVRSFPGGFIDDVAEKEKAVSAGGA